MKPLIYLAQWFLLVLAGWVTLCLALAGLGLAAKIMLNCLAWGWHVL